MQPGEGDEYKMNSTMRVRSGTKPRQRGAVSIPALSFILAVIVGIVVGVIVAMATEMIWLGIVIGVGAFVLTGIIAGAIYYASDFVRYKKIRQM